MLIKWRKQCCLLDVFRASDRNKMVPTVVFLFLFAHTGAQQSELEGPVNTLSIVGSTVTLNCSSSNKNCSGIDWQKYVPGASPMTIFKGPRQILNVSGFDRDRYSVDNSSGCDLVIRNVQLKDAGRFICSAIMSSNQMTKTAHLIILGTQPKCTINAKENDTAEEDVVQLKCEVTYNGTNGALMKWNGVTDVQNGNTTISRSYSVVASAPEVPSFTCETSFALKTNDDTPDKKPIAGLATNKIPNATCSTSAITVLYSVRDVTLLPLYLNYPTGTGITCAAKGNPSPTFKWQEKEDDGIWMDSQDQNGSQFTMSNVSSKKYRCVAMNVVRSKGYNATSDEFQVNNTDTTTAPMTSGHSFTLTVPMAIGGGVGIGVVLLLIIVIIIVCCCVRSCPCYKCCHSADNEKIKSKEQQQPLTEYPDIYCNISDAQRDAPKAQPRSAPASEPPKLPQNAPPKAKPRTDNAKAGKPNDYQPIHEEVTYAELATETAPRQVAPKYKDVPQETLYADVGTA